MRVAAIYNIHGNLPALEAVLKDIRQLEVAQIIVGGDVLPGHNRLLAGPQDFAVLNILQPPAQGEMLAAFSRGEI